MGLIISSGLTSVVTIYILIPFLLVPQLLMSGVIVKFDKLHSSIASKKYVSFVGDMMASRWVYEALAVNQFANNDYQSLFFNTDREISSASYLKNFYLPELLKRLQLARQDYMKAETRERAIQHLRLIGNELDVLRERTGRPFSEKLQWDVENFTPQHYSAAKNYFELLKLYYEKVYESAYNRRDAMYVQYAKDHGAAQLIAFKQDYHNEAIADLLLNSNEMTKITEADGRLIQQMDPVYRMPENNFGRAHFYSAYKRVFGRMFNTTAFNIVVLWLGTILLYLVLVSDAFRRLIARVERLRFRWYKLY